MDTGASESLGRPGLRRWKQVGIADPSLNERGGVFFAAVEMIRLPMIPADPHRADCPIAFANNSLLDLTGYELEEIISRNRCFSWAPRPTPSRSPKRGRSPRHGEGLVTAA